MRYYRTVVLVFLFVTVNSQPAAGGNGHMLHGFGPVNSPMAGAGAALALDPVGTLMFNPAAMAASTGNNVLFGTEVFEDGVEIPVEIFFETPNSGIFRDTLKTGVGIGLESFLPFPHTEVPGTGSGTEFGVLGSGTISFMDGRSGVNLNQPGGSDHRVKDAVVYKASVGPAWRMNRVRPCTLTSSEVDWTLGAGAMVGIGGASFDIAPNSYNPLDRQIIISAPPRSDALVGTLEAKVWTGWVFPSGAAAYLSTSFVGYQTDAVFGNANNSTSIAAGFNVTIPSGVLRR